MNGFKHLGYIFYKDRGTFFRTEIPDWVSIIERDRGTPIAIEVFEKDDSEYRLLDDTDTIQPDDEYLEDDCKSWSKVQRHFVGSRFAVNFFVPHRRLFDKTIHDK